MIGNVRGRWSQSGISIPSDVINILMQDTSARYLTPNNMIIVNHMHAMIVGHASDEQTSNIIT